MNISKVKLVDLITLRKWQYAVVGIYRALKFGVMKINKLSDLRKKINETDMPDHYKEQVLWRAKQCEECLIAGHCEYCGCDMPGKFLNDTDECDQGKWGPMKAKPVWEYFKEVNKI